MNDGSHPLIDYLIREHVAINSLATELQDVELADSIALSSRASAQFHTMLLPHFRMEEHVLFPFCSQRTSELDQLIYLLNDDHAEVEILFKKLESEVNQRSLLNSIGTLLSQHLQTEETEFLPLIQNGLSKGELDALYARIQTMDK
ncbi:MAG: hemerythrin domain-containing protein [Cryomorphaceae bacterium]